MNFISLFLNACRMEEICTGIILSTPVWRTTANLMEFFSWTVTQWVSVRSIIKLFWIFRDEWTLRAESNDYKKGCYLKQNFDLLRNRHQRMLNKLIQNDLLFLRRKYTIVPSRLALDMQIVMPRGELQVHVAKDNGILRNVRHKFIIRLLLDMQLYLFFLFSFWEHFYL